MQSSRWQYAGELGGRSRLAGSNMHSWSELVEMGLPRQLKALAEELGHRNRRAVRVISVPGGAASLAGLTLPLLCREGIAVDRSLLDDREHLARVVADGLAHMLHPRWSQGHPDDRGEMEEIASAVAVRLLSHPPYEPVRVEELLAEAGGRPAEARTVEKAGGGGRTGRLKLVSSDNARHTRSHGH